MTEQHAFKRCDDDIPEAYCVAEPDGVLCMRPRVHPIHGIVSAEEQIRQLHGECAELLRVLDRVRRIVYDRLDGHPTGRLILDTVNAPTLAERALQRATDCDGDLWWMHSCGKVAYSETDAPPDVCPRSSCFAEGTSWQPLYVLGEVT